MNKLYILCGLPFSGKSTLSKELAKRLGFTRIDLDDVKFELLGDDVNDDDIAQQDWDRIYQEMYRRIESALKEGKNVIHDTGNFTKYERGPVRQTADKLRRETKTIYVDTPKEVCFERLLNNRKTKERFDISDEAFQSTVEEMEVPSTDENTILFHTDSSLENWISENFNI